MIKRIHVNMHVIKANKKDPDNRQPPLTVKTYKDNKKVYGAEILDDQGKTVARLIYSPDNPMDCGATVWIETSNEVVTW